MTLIACGLLLGVVGLFCLIVIEIMLTDSLSNTQTGPGQFGSRYGK
jgi:hypothetical protein